MILSTATCYGIRALAYLAKQPKSRPCGLREIAEMEQIPALYLGKLLSELRRHRIVHSTKGIHGGYTLAQPPEAVTLLMVFRVLDANPNFDECLLGCEHCNTKTACPLKEEWQATLEKLIHLLEHHTIAQLVVGACEPEQTQTQIHRQPAQNAEITN